MMGINRTGFFGNRRVSFGNKAVISIFATTMMMQLVTYVSTVSSAVIASRIEGGAALCAVNLVSPLFSYAAFFSGMIGIGSALLYHRYLGACETERANEIFGQSVLLAAGTGLALLIAMILGKNAFLNGLDVSGTVRAEAEAFWKYEKYLIALAPMDFLLFELLYTDTRITAAANVVFFSVGIGASVYFTKTLGTMGTSLGMVAGTVLCDLVLCLHFLGKKNAFSFRLHFSWQDFREMCLLSVVDSSTYFDSGLLAVFINGYVILHFPEGMLQVASVMITVLDIVVVFDSVGSAFAPVAEVYLGEENNSDEKGVARFSLLLSVIFGMIVSALVFFFAPLIPKLFELTDPEQIDCTITALRLFAPSMTLYSVAYMLISQYIAVRRIGVAVAFEWTKTFILPALCILVFGKAFGFRGVWGSFLPAELLTTGGFTLCVWLFAGREKSIWLLEENRYPTFSSSYRLTEETVRTARDDIETFLLGEQVGRNAVYMIMLTVEEMTNLLLSRNQGRRVIVQYTVSLREDGIYLYERDNGEFYDLADSNMNISDIRDYIYSCIIDSYEHRQYLTVIDYNRNIFCYKDEEPAAKGRKKALPAE